mgnify:CR=1 FL=1
MATHSSIPAWRIPSEEAGSLLFMGLQSNKHFYSHFHNVQSLNEELGREVKGEPPADSRHEVPHPHSKDLNVGGRSTLASRADKVGSSCPTWTESQLQANERGG